MRLPSTLISHTSWKPSSSPELAGLHAQRDRVVGSTALATPRAASLSSAVRSAARHDGAGAGVHRLGRRSWRPASAGPGRGPATSATPRRGRRPTAGPARRGGAAPTCGGDRQRARGGPRRHRSDARATCASTCSRTRAGGGDQRAAAREPAYVGEGGRAARRALGAGLDVAAHVVGTTSSRSRTRPRGRRGRRESWRTPSSCLVELDQATSDVALDGAERQAGGLGDLGVAALLPEGEEHDRAARVGQLLDRLSHHQPFGDLVVGGLLGG